MSNLMSDLPPTLERLVSRFERASSNRLRHEQLLTLAKRLPTFPETAKVPETKVPGCVSNVYVTVTQDPDGKVHYQGDSDAQLTKGLLALLVEGFDGLAPAEVATLQPDFIKRTGLQVSLTTSRANGFYNMFTMMQRLAAEL